MPQLVRIPRVDDDGITLLALGDRPVDVCVDGRRIWTFWVNRDTEPLLAAPVGRRSWPVRRAAWPRSLLRHLNGRARITVRDSATDAVYFEREVALGEGEGPIRVRNEAGIDLGIDKSGKLVPTFAGRSESDIAALLDATEAVLGALRSAGLEPFLAYGTLLGAVREGAVLGHDSDADLGYVSRHTDPVDVARESFEVQRRLAREGWRITRYSGASFKILVTEGDVTRGLDVFGGFLDGGRLYLMGEIGTPFRPEWLHPLGTATLEGRPMPVPAQPERLLEATYGPGWKVPDPAFQFETPDRTIRALDDWFRGLQANSRYWERRAVMMRGRRRRGPSPLARLAHQEARSLGAEVLDVGAGRGADSLWLARQGVAVTAYDYVPRALEDVAVMAERRGLPLEVRYLNLAEWRSVYAEGTRLAHIPRPRIVLARHVVDATSGVGRASLARLCSMALRDGGRLLAEFHVRDDGGADRDDRSDRGDNDVDSDVGNDSDDDSDDEREGRSGGGAELPAWVVGRPDVEALTTLLRQAGARAVRSTDLDGDGPRTVRLVGEW